VVPWLCGGCAYDGVHVLHPGQRVNKQCGAMAVVLVVAVHVECLYI
jgi:hypothetical protein